MKKEIIKMVTQQIMGMLNNDVIEDNGIETFECWCVGGEKFIDDNPEAEEDDILLATHLMQEIAPFVDKLTEELERHTDGWKEPTPNYFLDYVEIDKYTGRKVSHLTEYVKLTTAKANLKRLKMLKYVVHASLRDMASNKLIGEFDKTKKTNVING